MMHHSQLEYIVAVQKLQRQDRGAKGYEVAAYLNVSPAYAVKLFLVFALFGQSLIQPLKLLLKPKESNNLN